MIKMTEDAYDEMLNEATLSAAACFEDCGIALESDDLHRLNDLMTQFAADRVEVTS